VTKLGPLAKAVAAAGIKVVRGGILADASVFDAARGVPQPGISGGPYLGPLSGLDYNSGFVHGHLAASPPKVAAVALGKKLRRRGVEVDGKIRVGHLPPSVREIPPLAGVSSPSVGTLIAATNLPLAAFFDEMLA